MANRKQKTTEPDAKSSQYKARQDNAWERENVPGYLEETSIFHGQSEEAQLVMLQRLNRKQSQVVMRQISQSHGNQYAQRLIGKLNSEPQGRLPSDNSEYENTKNAPLAIRQPTKFIGVQNTIVQTFSPASHRSATTEGLSRSFSAEEIGAIYQSNWERDFSQGPKEIADMVLAWKAAKQSAAENGGNPSASSAATFRSKVWQVIDMDLLDSTNESLSGYHSWEHMDNPGDDAAEEADERWEGKGGNLPGYINDSKAYIKDEIVAATDQYRSFIDKGKIGQGIDNWNGVEKPEGYSPQALDNAAWIGDSEAPTINTELIANEAAQQAIGKGAKSKQQASWEKALWRAIGYHLGRAMHATEDFFAHSNWLEVAKAYKASPGSIPASIRTGTFEMPDKAHALGHKLVSLSGQLLTDFDLLLKLYNRTKASTKLNPNKRGDWFSGPNTNDFAFGPLETDSWTPLGEIMDIGIMADNMEELVQSGQLEVEDFLLNKDWLTALQNKGHILIEEGDKEAPDTGHGKMAKDQDEAGKDHSQARAIAVEANRLIFDPLRKIMDMEDVKAAKDALVRQLELVDLIIAPPSDSHPLIGLVGEVPASTGSSPSELGDYPLPTSDTRFA